MATSWLQHGVWLVQRPQGSLLLLHLAPHQHGKLPLKDRIAKHGRMLPQHQQALYLLGAEKAEHGANGWNVCLLWLRPPICLDLLE